MERLSQEIKRRTRVERIVATQRVPGREACLRLVTALAMEQSDEWVSGRRYRDVTIRYASLGMTGEQDDQ